MAIIPLSGIYISRGGPMYDGRKNGLATVTCRLLVFLSQLKIKDYDFDNGDTAPLFDYAERNAP